MENLTKMRQFRHKIAIADSTRWASYNDKIGACSNIGGITDLVKEFNWTKDTLEGYVIDGTLVECSEEEFLHIEDFNNFFGILNTETKTQSNAIRQCNCDFTLLLQKGCQCGGV